MLGQRLQTLEQEIAEEARSRDLLAALVGRSRLKDWHEAVERVAWLSKDMNAHDDYMVGFMEVFSELDWWGPATAAATRRALGMVPFAPETILEIGCGPGMATMTLAEVSAARITATDAVEGAPDRLRARVAARGTGRPGRGAQR